jgi:hypothetical protein
MVFHLPVDMPGGGESGQQIETEEGGRAAAPRSRASRWRGRRRSGRVANKSFFCQLQLAEKAFV